MDREYVTVVRCVHAVNLFVAHDLTGGLKNKANLLFSAVQSQNNLAVC